MNMTQLELKNELENINLDNFDHGYDRSQLNRNAYKACFDRGDDWASKIYIPTSTLTHIMNVLRDYESNLWDNDFTDGKHDATEVGDLFEDMHNILIDNGITEYCLSENCLSKNNDKNSTIDKFDEIVKNLKIHGFCKSICVDTNKC